MTTYIFPGQGSQHRGMGQDLFHEFPQLVQNANDILGYSVANLCLENANEMLNQTRFTQPAIYIVSVLSYLKKIQTSNQKPNYVAGHSLGEYSALFAAGTFDFETGLKLVKRRGELMNEASDGGMAAIIGLKSDKVKDVLQQENLTNITIANYNSYTQVVISGPKNAIVAAQPLFEKAGASLFIPLKVSGAFHSLHMNSAQQDFAKFLSKFNFNVPTIPVIANINAKPYQPHEIQLYLTQQIIFPVQWTLSIEYLLKQGEAEFIEIGPGTILTGLIRRIQNGQ